MQTPLQSTTSEVPPADSDVASDAVFQSVLDAVERHKKDPDYVKRLFEGAAEARRRLNAEYLREMDISTHSQASKLTCECVS